MKRILLLVCCAIFGLQVCHAQFTTKRITVAVGEFTGNYAEEMRSACLSSIPTHRVVVVDLNEAEMEDVDYIITGTTGEITSVSKDFTGPLTGENYTIYVCSLSYTLKLTNAKTNEVEATHNFRSTGTDKDLDAATNGCFKMEEKELRQMIDKGCPIKVPVAALDEVKKDKAKTLVIDAGSTIGICEGMHFDIQAASTIAGRPYYKTIGAAKVKEVLADNLTVCEITKGNKEVNTAFTEGTSLILVSKE